MKVRVIKTKDGKFKSEYFCEHENLGWTATYGTFNEFDTIEEAIEECEWFAENNNEREVVWEKEI